MHGFLRYALPGYAFWTVFLIPAFANYNKFKETIPIFTDYFGPVFFILSGPVLGYIFFHIYYIPFERWYLEDASWRQAMSRHFKSRLPPFSESQYRWRALYDLAYYDKENIWKDRIDYLFSSFHSLATCWLAMSLAFIFWICYSQIGIKISPVLWLGGSISLIAIKLVFSYHYLDRYHLARPMEEMVVLRNLSRIEHDIRLLEFSRRIEK